MAVYYLSPTGNDTTGTGSISAPWFTLEKAWDNIVAGDIVYMRGGTYNYLKTQWLTGVTGTSGNIISLLNYPGETPIIQPATGWVYDGWYYGILFQSMNYIHVKGLEVRNFKYQQTSPCRAIMAQHISNSIFENLSCHDSEMGMMLTGNSGDNLILNCDFYENYDPYSSPQYNNGDGLDVSSIPNSYSNTIRGCRSWYNADDGFDLWASEGIVYVDNCWAWSNGYQEDHVSYNEPPMIGNDGNGFKLGQVDETTSTTRRYLYNCIGAINRVNNFSHNVVDPQVLTCELYNCFSYGAVGYAGYQFNWGAQAATNSILRNNVSYNDANAALVDTWVTHDHNSWNAGYTVTAADFVSLDTSELFLPRRPDGSLPIINFGRLVSGSDLINTGIDVGLPFSGSAPDLGPFEFSTTYYISTTGVDDAGRNGGVGQEWATLSYACTRVTTPGDTIMVGVGTFTETAQSVLAVGVSIVGAGETSIIKAGAALDPIILLSSASEGADGNQSISHLQIDGDLTALTLIKVFARSNVKIHDCTFIDAVEDGVQFYGRTDELYQFTTTYSTGNEFYNNTMINCASYGVYDTWRYIHGCLCFGGQSGMLIHDNTITVSDRGAANGAPISFTNRGNHMGTKIYNNTLYTPPKKAETSSGGGYAFAIEMWSQRGGVEIYDNDITGAIDVGGYDTNDDGGYGYALKIYRNTIGIPALSAYNHYLLHLELGVHDGTFIYQNYFYNASRPVTFSTTSSALVQGQEDIYIYYNIFNNVRKSGTGWFGYCFDINPSVAVTIHNLQILNNVVYAPTELLYAFIQSNDATTTFTDMVVRNNIVSNAHACVEITNGTVTGINVDNNDFYNTSHQTDYTGSTVTGNTLNNNITSDPLFVTVGSDFHLQSTSPCINAGIDVGLLSDYLGNPIIGLPDIGAYEYSLEIINNDISILTINKFAII